MTGKEKENPETGGQWTTADRLMILRRIDVAATSEQLRADLTIAQRQLLQAGEDKWEASERARLAAQEGAVKYPNAQPTNNYQSAEYSYHAGTFQVHGEDTVYSNEVRRPFGRPKQPRAAASALTGHCSGLRPRWLHLRLLGYCDPPTMGSVAAPATPRRL